VIVLVVIAFLALENIPGEKPKTVASKQVLLQENPNDPHQAFLGHYGYVLRLPLGYQSLSDFKDPEQKIEVVYLFPNGTDLNNLPNEGLYGPLGILRLEVSPRRIPGGNQGLELARNEVIKSLQQQKTVYSMRDTLVGGLQAIVINVGDP